jgi:RHS repeat-associated protein
MWTAKQDADVFPLAAFCLLAENSHRGHRLPTAALHRGFTPINSNTATGFDAFLYDFGRRSRSTGKERDSETGLDYFGARYFSGAQGRFTSPDWSAKPQPVPYARLGDPETLNLYGYVRNNPLSTADKDGHCDVCWWLSKTINNYLASHPKVADAANNVVSEGSATVRGGVGGGGELKGLKGDGSVTAYAKASGKGAGAGIDAKVAGGVGSISGEASLNIPFVKDGALVNPLSAGSFDLSGNAGAGTKKVSASGSENKEEASIGGTVGEGVVVGAEVSSSNDSLKELLGSIGEGIVSDVKEVINEAKQAVDQVRGANDAP